MGGMGFEAGIGVVVPASAGGKCCIGCTAVKMDAEVVARAVIFVNVFIRGILFGMYAGIGAKGERGSCQRT